MQIKNALFFLSASMFLNFFKKCNIRIVLKYNQFKGKSMIIEIFQ